MTLERLSALMDGELDQDQAASLFAQLKTDATLPEAWNDYHLIGEALRHQGLPDARLGRRIAAALSDEPTVFVPAVAHHVKTGNEAKVGVVRHRWAAVAAAVAVVSLVTWFIPGNSPQPATGHVVAQRAPVAEGVLAASTLAQADPTANEEPYVAMHRQWSPISGFQTVDYSATGPQ